MIDVAEKYPNHIHAAFAFNYDVVMMMLSLGVEKSVQLKSRGYTFYRQYRLEYRPGKWFTVTDREKHVSCRINDIFSFFAKSAIASAEEYLPDDEYLPMVRYGKSKRDSFEYAQLHMVRTYMHVELRLYLRLIERLRLLLSELGVFPQGWYGPGAVATAVMRKYGIKKAMDRNLPDAVIEAAQHAYFGGRFEQFKTGRYYGTVYGYDIRSAYPAAMVTMPNLQKGFWIHREISIRELSQTIQDFSLYRVRYTFEDRAEWIEPQPFPRRTRNGAIGYPNQVENWYWGVEVRAALESGRQLDIVEAWEFIQESESRPFAFLAELYEQRAQWKTEGNPVQLAAKLVLNSIYGKLAQRVGWNEQTGQAPTWHQLEYAGYITAHCRAAIWRAISQNPSAVIAVETDGIYTTEPLDLPEDFKNLGDWERTKFDGITYVQSGVYWTLGNHAGRRQWSQGKTRGFTKKNLNYDMVKEKISTLEALTVTTKRFAGFSYATRGVMTQWIEKSHTLEWGGSGKRKHIPANCTLCCSASDDGKSYGFLFQDHDSKNGISTNQFHDLTITDFIGGSSWKHVLPWRDVERHPRWDDDQYKGFEDLNKEVIA